jgi:iron complex outermembrane receptor protein
MLIFLFIPVSGQISIGIDTIKINEVVISRSSFYSEQQGYKKTTFDSAVLVNYSTCNLSDMLSENTDILIKNYGMGGSATPSFRGTSAGHTLISWNGISINNPMLGQSDLSLIPVGLIDDIKIYFGGASMSLNSGGIGGTIDLETKPEWKKETSFSINTGTGSFGRYSGLLKLKTGNHNFQTVTKGYFQKAENDFRYLNSVISSEPVWQRRTNSQVSQKGFIQEFYLRGSNNVSSARIWYQSSDRNLPASLLVPPNSGERQSDESLRTMLNWDLSRGRSNISFTGAWMLNRLNYSNRLASIDSRNLSENLVLKASLRNPMGEFAYISIVVEEQITVVKTNNYDHNITRSTANLTTSIVRNKGRLGSTILVRGILDRNTFLIPDISAGAQFRILTNKEYYLKANISRNSKIPTMNDLFWEPGGNRDLKNEYAFMYEISGVMDQKISDRISMKYDIAFFRYNINDMILWHQGEYSYWNPDNIEKVRSSGLESTLSLNYMHNYINSSLKAAYSFTRATTVGSNNENDVSVGKQLMYIPENKANASFSLSYKNIYTQWMAGFTGKRYISVDNSEYLREHLINNLTTGIKFNFRSSMLDINFNIVNLLNVNYQTIAYFPLPGRMYNLKVLFQIIK